MEYALQFKKFVKNTVKKNMAFLPDLTEFDIESECWAFVAIAIGSWDGSKGNIRVWVSKTVSCRMVNLRKLSPVEIDYSTDFLETLIPENEMEAEPETASSPLN
jgi:hypothetical protein